MVNEVVVATGVVATVKDAVVALAATVTLDGTCAATALLLTRVTTAPPAGVGPFNATVPVEVAPPNTDAGLMLTDASTEAVTVKPAVWVVPKVAEMVSDVLPATGLVVTVKVAVVAPGATVTLAGTLAAAVLLLDRMTTVPPAGAGPFNVTVPVDVPPPNTDAGLKLTEETVGKETKLNPETFAPLIVVVWLAGLNM